MSDPLARFSHVSNPPTNGNTPGEGAEGGIEIVTGRNRGLGEGCTFWDTDHGEASADYSDGKSD